MRCQAIRRVAVSLCFIVLLLVSLPVSANPKYAGLVINADTGEVLYQQNANYYRYPASLTKMMTIYMAFEAVKTGKLKMNERLYVSRRAAAQPRSKLGLKRGQTIKLRDAIISLIVKSANDSAVVIAEAIAGTEWEFARQMTRKARELGLNRTTFKNASGLHHRRQRTTASDMAKLAIALYRDYRKYYHLFSRTKFYYGGTLYKGHNRLVGSYRGADGMKTGYIRASGYNLVTTVKRGKTRLIGVVMGGKTSKRRDKHMRNILDRSFYQVAKSHQGKGYFSTPPAPIPRPTSVTSKHLPSPKPKQSRAQQRYATTLKPPPPVRQTINGIPIPVYRP